MIWCRGVGFVINGLGKAGKFKFLGIARECRGLGEGNILGRNFDAGYRRGFF